MRTRAGVGRLSVLGVAVVCVLLVVAGSGAVAATQEAVDLQQAIARLGVVTSGLATVSPLGRPLALSTLTPGGVDGLGLADAIAAATSERVTAPQSRSDLVSQLTTASPVDLGLGRTASVTATPVPATGGVDGFDLTVSVVRHEAAASFSLASASPRVTLGGAAAAAVDLSLSTTFALRYDTTSRAIWLDAPSCRAPSVAIDASVKAVAGASGGLGVLGVKFAQASGPMLSAAEHLVALLGTPDAQCRVMLMAPNGSGNESPAGLAAGGLTATFAASPASKIQGSVSVSADTSGSPGLASLTSANGTLSVSDPDLGVETPPTVDASGLGSLAGFSNLTPSDLAGDFAQLSSFLRGAVQLTIPAGGGHTLGDLPLPFMKGRLSDALPISEVLDRFLTDHAPNGTPDFSSVQELLSELAATSVDGATVSVDNASWSAAGAKLAFGIHVQSARSNVPLDPAEGGAEDPHTGEVDFGGALAPASGIGGLAAVHAVATSSPSYRLDVTPVLDLAAPAADETPQDRLLLRTGSSLIAADVPVTTSVDATGQAGVIPIHAGGTVLVSPPAQGHMLEIALKARGDVTLPQAAADLGSAPGSLLSVSNGGAATASLGLDVPGSSGFFGNSTCANASVPGCTDATVSWADIGDPASLSVSGGQLPGLKAFGSGAGDPRDLELRLKAELGAVASSLGNLSGLTSSSAAAFAQQIPFLGTSFASLLDGSALQHALDALGSTPAPTLADFAAALNSSLPRGSSIDFRLGSDGTGNTVLLAHLKYHFGVDRQLPLDLQIGLPDGPITLVGAASSGSIHVVGHLDADMTLALPVGAAALAATPSDVRVLPTSSVTGSLTADGSGIFSAYLGPFTVRLGGPGDSSIFHAAVDAAVGVPSPGTNPVSLTDWAAALTASMNQSSPAVHCGSDEVGYGLDVCARLPVYLSNDGGQTYSRVTDTGNNDAILRLPANDASFDPTGAQIQPPSLPPLDRLVLPDGLASALAGSLLSFDSIRGGVDATLSLVARGLGAASDGGKLPFVGSDLQEGQHFVQNLQSELDTVFSTLPPASVATAGDIRADIRNGIGSALGSGLKSSVTVDLTCPTAACADTDPATSIVDARVAFDAGGGGGISIPLRIGIPGLAISSSSPLSASLGWTLHLAFGLNRHGFYLRPGNNLSVGLQVDAPTGITANLGALQATVADLNGGGVPTFAGTARLALKNAGDIGLGDLVGQDTNLVDASMSAHAKADWRVTGTVSSALPGMSADFHLDWSWPDSQQPTVLRFDNVSVVPGALIQGVLGPAARELDGALGPLQPFIDDLTAPLPILSDLSHDVGGGDVTVNGLLGIGADLSGDQRVELVHRVAVLTSIVNRIAEVAGNNQPIPLGSFDVNPQDALAGYAPDQELANAQPDPQQSWSGLTTTLFDLAVPAAKDADLLQELLHQDQSGFSFPAFDHPSQLFGLLLGQDVDLVKYDAGTLHADLGPPLDGLSFPSNDALPINLGLTANATIDGYFTAGFDTYGIRQALDNGQVAGIINGFWIGTRDASNRQAPNLHVSGEASITGGVSIGIASVGGGGGISLDTTLGLYDPANTGKFRPSKIAQLANGPGCVFVTHMKSLAFLQVNATLGVSPFSKTWSLDLGEKPLFDLRSVCKEGGNDDGIQFGSGGGGGGYSHYVPQPQHLGTGQFVDPERFDTNDAVDSFNNAGDVVWMNRDGGEDYLWHNGHNTALGSKYVDLQRNFHPQVDDAGQVVLRAADGTLLLRQPSGVTAPLPTPPGDNILDQAYLAAPYGACTPSVYGTGTSGAWVIRSGAVSLLPHVQTPLGDEQVGFSAVSPSGAYVFGWAPFGPNSYDTHAYQLVNGVWKDVNALVKLPAGDIVTAVSDVADNGTMLAYVSGIGLAVVAQNGTVTPTVNAGVGPRTINSNGDVVAGQIADVNVVGQAQVYHHGNAVGLEFASTARVEYTWALNDRGQVLASARGNFIGTGPPAVITIPSWRKSPPPAPASACPPPNTPLALRSATSARDVKLTWQAPDGALDVSGYHVYRFTDATRITRLADVAADATSYTDASPVAGAKYAVSAEGLGGEGNIALTAPGAAAARATVAPTSSAVITLPHGRGNLNVPAGIAATPTTFTYVEPAPSRPEAGSFAFAGVTFTLSATDAFGVSLTHFAHPYTLTLAYDPSLLPAGTDESSLNLYSYNGSAWQPALPCSGCSLDTRSHTITVVLDHLTEFALFASSASAPSVQPTPVTPAGVGVNAPATSDENPKPAAGGIPPGGGVTPSTATPVVTSIAGAKAPAAARVTGIDYSLLHRKHLLRVTVGNPNSFTVTQSVAPEATYLAPAPHGRHVKLRIALPRFTVTLHAGARRVVSLVFPRQKVAQLLKGQQERLFFAIRTSAPLRPATTRQISIKVPASRLRS